MTSGAMSLTSDSAVSCRTGGKEATADARKPAAGRKPPGGTNNG